VVEIGLNGLLLDSPHSGTATYSRELAWRLPDAAPDLRFRLFTRRAAIDGDVRVQRISSPFSPFSGSRTGARLDKLAWEALSLPAASALHRESLLHSLYFAAPPVAATPLVVTIHDLIPLAVAGHHRGRQPELYSRFMAWTTRRAAAIITVSEHSKRDIVRLLGVPPSRVIVTPEAAGERFSPAGDVSAVRERYGLPDRYILYLGGAERRKNIEMLVRAFARSKARQDGYRLVLVARFPPPDSLYPDIPRLIRELQLESHVTVVQEIAEADKPAVYRGASVFCYPSLYEGFGLPPLEAMASGTPVIAADATSLPEVVGTAGRLLTPDAPLEWADALDELVGNPKRRAALSGAGLRRAAEFSWQRTAEQTVAVYRRLLS